MLVGTINGGLLALLQAMPIMTVATAVLTGTDITL
jgi:hypothetical protein